MLARPCAPDSGPARRGPAAEGPNGPLQVLLDPALLEDSVLLLRGFYLPRREACDHGWTDLV